LCEGGARAGVGAEEAVIEEVVGFALHGELALDGAHFVGKWIIGAGEDVAEVDDGGREQEVCP